MSQKAGAGAAGVRPRLGTITRRCALDDCGASFDAQHASGAFCSEACRDAHAAAAADCTALANASGKIVYSSIASLEQRLRDMVVSATLRLAPCVAQ